MEASVPSESSLRAGASVASGLMFMGNVGEGEVRDFTVIGDVVNTAARLQGEALPGEVLITEDRYRTVAAQFPDAPQRTPALKGKGEPVPVRVLRERPAIE